MAKVKLVFTKSNWDIVSFAIRYALPRSRLSLALSSHVLVVTPDGQMYDCDFFKGVKKGPIDEIMKNRVVVKEIEYSVPNPDAGYAFAEAQLGKKYDKLGVFGLLIDPNRDWAEDDKWFCYEFGAAVLKHSGLDIFENLNHITEIPLMALKT